jgi:large repetitive protein
VTFEDAVNGAPVTVDVVITINDLPPAHAIANATGGDGSSATPYTAVYTETMDANDDIDLASVADPNTAQALSISGVTPGANPAGGAGFTFTLAGGFLNVAPNGTLDANDVGTHTFDVDVTDTNNTVTISVSIDVAAVPAITTASPLPNGEQGVSYGPLQISTTGGTGALGFAVTAGALPPGISMSTGGELTGTPTAAGSYNFTVTVTDTLGVSGTGVFDITIDPPAAGSPTITTTTLPSGTIDTAYGPVSITATGGTPGYSFAVTGGALPLGITLSTAGELSGTPTVSGSFAFDVTVTDSAFATDSASLTLNINSKSSGGGSSGGGGCAASGSSTGLWLVLFVLASLAVYARRRTA